VFKKQKEFIGLKKKWDLIKEDHKRLAQRNAQAVEETAKCNSRRGDKDDEVADLRVKAAEHRIALNNVQRNIASLEKVELSEIQESINTYELK